MRVRVFQPFVSMRMLVALAHAQPHTRMSDQHLLQRGAATGR